jgi:hypothetical protein
MRLSFPRRPRPAWLLACLLLAPALVSTQSQTPTPAPAVLPPGATPIRGYSG